MKIIKTRPPNFNEIIKVFPMAAGRGVIFAYGDTIYAPFIEVTPELIAHENVHGHRQLKMGVEEWWKRYLEDIPFRYEEELPAHRAEFRHLCSMSGNEKWRRMHLDMVAMKLAAPLYGRMVNLKQAKQDILAGNAI